MSKPVSRRQFLLGKFLGILLASLVMIALLGVFFTFVLWFKPWFDKETPPDHKYVYGVLVDMIGDKNLQIYQEGYSLRYAPQVTQSLWKTAKSLGVKEFIARRKHEVRDDHLPLNKIAGIPTCDLIDFDYPHWHLISDTPAQCSPQSLAQVGRVVTAWLTLPEDRRGPNARP